jgi:hypothetical protein
MITFLDFGMNQGISMSASDNFFFSLPASMAVLFFLLSVGVTVIKGK